MDTGEGKWGRSLTCPIFTFASTCSVRLLGLLMGLVEWLWSVGPQFRETAIGTDSCPQGRGHRPLEYPGPGISADTSFDFSCDSFACINHVRVRYDSIRPAFHTL